MSNPEIGYRQQLVKLQVADHQDVSQPQETDQHVRSFALGTRDLAKELQIPPLIMDRGLCPVYKLQYRLVFAKGSLLVTMTAPCLPPGQ